VWWRTKRWWFDRRAERRAIADYRRAWRCMTRLRRAPWART